MDKPLSSLDWSLIQAFLRVARAGSLSAASRETGSSQPTMGRLIRKAEAELGVTLFRRQPRGLVLTEAGRMLLPAAEAMQDAAGRVALIAAGRERRLEGDVRITASVVMSHFILPPILARLREEEPGIRVDLVPSDRTENLLFREADIALRMYRPEQLDVVTRHIADFPIGIFAARRYLERRGQPAAPEDLLAHDFVGYDRDDRIIRGMVALGWEVERGFFTTRSDDQAAYWHLVRAGCGIGVGPVPVGMAETGLVRLFPGLPIPPLPIWLAAHEAMRHTPRIRRVWEALADGVKAAVS